MLPNDRECKRTLPAVPRVGDHIGWSPDRYHEEHTVASVYWDLDSPEGTHVLITLEERKVDGKSVNPPAEL
ncbi:hypothetical protein [Streptomyces regalis]|uniref:Uncharacterized protein n=1 Tax=Streptomyces regalis TaxID=68262 RepID=A0A0X3URL3_9ACTN|nr:hypothetical protein [Streptomyces regalis]KUL34777.1 hypothetical protein ADL12_20645 [Streptomyces regalis]